MKDFNVPLLIRDAAIGFGIGVLIMLAWENITQPRPVAVPPLPPPGAILQPSGQGPQQPAAPIQPPAYQPMNTGFNPGDYLVWAIASVAAYLGIRHDLKKLEPATAANVAALLPPVPPSSGSVVSASNTQPNQLTKQKAKGSTLTAIAPWEERKAALWQLLEEELPAVLQLLEATPILAVGPQRSGKTSFAVALALTRQVLLGYGAEVATPHQHDTFPPSFGVWRELEGVQDRIHAYFDRIGQGDRSPISLLFDELTSYAAAELEGADRLMLSFLSESQKHEKFVIGLSHGITNATLGGANGTAQMRQQGLIIVERSCQMSKTGRRSPNPLIRITGLSEAPLEFVLPDWFHADHLLEFFPELQEGRSPSPDASSPEFPREVLEAVYTAAKKRNRPVSARDIQQARLPDLDGYSADQIRAVFLSLERMGRGKTDGLGSGITYAPNP
ncbi:MULTISPECIES: hypothetical protein [unclassified Leptolyngbya]|uniref:hypothetical protein n=1 Tax=unclassified Leptolyngbya TaxID=2650499 RepID=UPI00168691A1|nr:MULTISPECIES: hypothetical protein [unclassified Leptolyngbya]MBD1913618.1 hypothetical protein [Leptolyngbya sp. FACHB-8]MBD2154051.1 hypothetical protein [Leptolyngbya sp. FACHB-16]